MMVDLDWPFLASIAAVCPFDFLFTFSFVCMDDKLLIMIPSNNIYIYIYRRQTYISDLVAFSYVYMDDELLIVVPSNHRDIYMC